MHQEHPFILVMEATGGEMLSLQTIFRSYYPSKRGIFLVCFQPRAPNYSSLFFERVQSTMLYPAIPSVPNSNNPTVLET